MGLFGNAVSAITGAVAIDYKVNTEQAKAAVKGLSGVQKKAALEQVKALEEQGKAAESMAGQYAKGGAIILAAAMAAKDGLAQMREEARLTQGSAGVNIDSLSESWDGLKTRMELMTLAQAGHRGAWKLTTGQLQLVSEGMRALTKEGYEADKIFDRFTEVLKKGKLEGLDEFGLSVKSTGDQSKDLQVLMAALGKEVATVGGNFEMAGDQAQRSIVKMEDGIARLRVTVGKLTAGILDMAAAYGEGMGEAVFGSLPEERGTEGRAAMYANSFRYRRGGNLINTQHQGISGSRNGLVDQRWGLFANPDDAEKKAGETLSRFKSQVNRSIDGKGPLATASPAEFAKLVAGLPADWRLVDDELAKRVDAMQAKLVWRMASGINNAAAPGGPAGKPKGKGRGGRGAAVDTGPTVFDSILDTASGFYGFAIDEAGRRAEEARYQDVLAQRQAAQAEELRRLSVDIQSEAAGRDEAERESFLERTFGKLEEFDAYAAGFGVLKSEVTDGFRAWISGAESVGTAVRRSIASSLGGYAVEMAGRALVAGAHSVFHFATGDVVGGSAMAASAAKYAGAAVALGVLAKAVAPGSASASTAGAAGSGAGARGGSAAASGPRNAIVGQTTNLVMSPGWDDDSPRQRARRIYRAVNSTNAAYRPPGAS